MQKSAKWWKIDENWPNFVKNGEKLKKICLQSCENRQKCGRNVGRIAKFDFLVFVIDDSFVTWRAWRAFGSVCFPAEGVATPPRLSRSLLNPDHTQLLPHFIDFYVAFTTDRIIIKSDNQISCVLNSLRQRALRAILSEKFQFILFRPIWMEIQRLPVDFQWFSTRNAVSFHEIQPKLVEIRPIMTRIESNWAKIGWNCLILDRNWSKLTHFSPILMNFC